MKTKTNTKIMAAVLCAGAATNIVSASTDYGPAIWRPACSGKWNTTGSGHKFAVIHDMEGYYAYEVSSGGGLRSCSTTVSVHYCVNGKQDATSDYPAGEITQEVSEAYYAWHARCWNGHSVGTEHEGFRSNPAWYTDAMYNATGPLQRHFADKFGFPKDRNHFVGHDAKSSSAWVSYANANLGINASCNTHDDPGPYWDWTKLMNIINPPVTAVTVDNSSAGFSVTGTWSTGSSSTDKYGADYRYHSTAPISEPAQWLASVSGTKSVYAWWPQGSNRSTSAGYIVTHDGGTTTVNKNQQTGGGAWQLLGSWSMSTGKVQLSCWTGTGFIVVADAVKWQ
jgi:N-acetyl-anhydromuramyl-L-alanine amidase AmpD